VNYVVWDNAWSVGVAEIDRQHRKIIDMINRFESARLNGMSAMMIESILEELKKYTQYHFSLEEMYFDEFHYEDADKHRASHEVLTTKVESFRHAFAERREGLTEDMVQFLQGWLNLHIKGSDLKYKDCFLSNGLQ
jgi:hemerythrin